MTIDKAFLHLENMKWLKGYDNTTIDGRPLSDVIDGIIDLLKAKEPTLEQVAADYGLTPDGVSFALEQYQKVICEITHSRMSKLSYYADDILSVANDVRCDGCEYVEPYILAINEVASWVEKRRVDREPIWIETKDGICACIVSDECWDINTQADLSADLYSKTWRCWNIKPSDEQRKNTPWKK